MIRVLLDIDTIVTSDVGGSLEGDGCVAVGEAFVSGTTRVTCWGGDVCCGGVWWWLRVAIEPMLLCVVVGGSVDSGIVVEEVLELIVSIIE